MKGLLKITAGAVTGLACPFLSQAQSTGLSEGIKGLQGVLDQLYTTMLPQCSALIGVGQGIAGFAALWFIGVRVWRHIANAEPVDVFPLLSPFAKGGAILLFPYLISLINGVLQPTVTGTAQMEETATSSIALLLQQKEEALKNTDAHHLFYGDAAKGEQPLWEVYAQAAGGVNATFGFSTAFGFSMAKAYYAFKNSVKEWMSDILEIVYEAAALCINTLRTFQLIVLAILGPLVLGLSVFDGFQSSLHNWLSRYICVYLWLPVANIFGAIIANIQVAMLKLDLSQIQSNGDTYFSSTDTGYLIFLIIGIVGYFTVPSVASYIVSVGDSGGLSAKVTQLAGAVTKRGKQFFTGGNQ